MLRVFHQIVAASKNKSYNLIFLYVFDTDLKVNKEINNINKRANFEGAQTKSVEISPKLSQSCLLVGQIIFEAWRKVKTLGGGMP